MHLTSDLVILWQILIKVVYFSLILYLTIYFKMMIKKLLFSTFCLFVFSLSFGQRDLLTKEFHKNRREELRKKMPLNSVAVFFANPPRTRSNDTDYLYHQDPDFYYLTGYMEPNAVLVIYSETQMDSLGQEFDEILYVQKKEPRLEQWLGKRLGIEGAKQKLGFNTVFNADDFINSSPPWNSKNYILFKEFSNDYRNEKYNKADMFDLVSSFKKQISLYDHNNAPSKDLNNETPSEGLYPKLDSEKLKSLMAELRQFKQPEEISLIRKAASISAIAQVEVMKAMNKKMSETEIQGIHEFVFKKYGSEYEGYPSIVGSGENGCVLHYVLNNRKNVSSDLVLMDLGAEYHGYTADVTRTIPSDGSFSPEQKIIYDLVLKAQKAGIEAARPGNPFNAPDKEARKVITDGLLDLGIIKDPAESRKYFPHGASHHLGLDVHDPSVDKILQENMIITVEPGIYIPEGSNCDPKWYSIGVRIEDDILITGNKPVNLSDKAPRSAEEIEALMKQKSPLDDFVLPGLPE